MKRFCSSWLLVMGLAHAAVAQSPRQVEPATAPFLEKRVPEELAAEGVVLSRNNLGLKLEQVGVQWLVSLVDLTTERVAASTELDVLPPDREAAVAALTHVVAELATQVIGHPERAPAPPSPAAAPPPVVIDQAERDRREIADQKFQREAIRFNASSVRGGTVEASTQQHRWVAFRGDLEQELPASEFYTMVGRPELAGNERARRQLKIGGFIIGAAGVAAMAVVYELERSRSNDQLASCTVDLPPGQFQQCLSDSERHYGTTLVAGGVGVFGIVLGLWFALHPHPIEAEEARSLAADYNEGVRRRLGLPSFARRPVLRDLQLAPYATGTTGGIALSARF
jgi:hypothetical protein